MNKDNICCVDDSDQEILEYYDTTEGALYDLNVRLYKEAMAKNKNKK